MKAAEETAKITTSEPATSDPDTLVKQTAKIEQALEKEAELISKIKQK